MSSPVVSQRVSLVAAITSLWLVWGSTYLAIALAVRSMPPLLMASLRFILAGGILLLFLRCFGRPWPSLPQLRSSSIIGILLLLGGNGVVCLVAHAVPSGVVALIIASTTLFMVLITWGMSGHRPSPTTWTGIALGSAGVAVLVWHPGADFASAPHWPWWAPVLLLVASFSWALGSALSKRLAMPADPWMSTAWQMVLGGLAMLLVASAHGEWSQVDVYAITRESWLAWSYLVVFGSIVGFGSYIWLLRHASPALATSYAYVNPLVALVLGAWLNHETISGQTLMAAGLIIAAVIVIATAKK